MGKEYDWNGKKIVETDDWDVETGNRKSCVCEVIGPAKTDDRFEFLKRNAVGADMVLAQLYKYLKHAIADRVKANDEIWAYIRDMNPELFKDGIEHYLFNHNKNELERPLTDEERGEFSAWKWEQKEKAKAEAAEKPK